METNESNLKPQPTGLKLMTVFIAVLALHVLVIGGFTVWQFLKPSASDDLAMDKNHKGAKIVSDTTVAGDISSTDGMAADKPLVSGPATVDKSTPPTVTEASSAPAAAASSTPSSASATAELAPRPAPAPLNVTPPPADNDASSVAANPTAQTPSGPVRHGPVINPPEALAPPEPSDSTATTAPADASTPVADGTPYTVKKGDSLARIAHRHHVALVQLKTANSLASDKLKIGQKLVIPNRAEKVAAADITAPAATPEMTSIETSTNTSTDVSEGAATSAATPVATTTTKPAHAHKTSSSAHHLYTVVKGDTLIKIARRFRTTPSAIMTANNITNASRLSIGKKLHIPSGESRSAAASSAPAEAPAEQEAKPAAHGQLANYVQ
jgi:LysM repeat protein